MIKAIKVAKLIEVMKSRDLVSRNELSEILGVDKKTISKYIGEINAEGMYFITSITGPNGGYKLSKKNLPKDIYLDNDEKRCLEVVRSIIETNYKEIYSEFENVCKKILSLDCEQIISENSNFIYKSYDNDIDVYKERRKCINLEQAIMSQSKVVLIDYKKINSDRKSNSNRVIHPYGIINYKSAPYLVGYCELRKELRFFKVSRINSYKITDEKFTKVADYSKDELLNYCIGIYKGEEFKIRCNIKFPFDELISEKIWTKDQKIRRIDEDTIEFVGTLEGEEEIITWLLTMKDRVNVIEPKYIVEKYNETVKKIYKKIY